MGLRGGMMGGEEEKNEGEGEEGRGAFCLTSSLA